MYQSQWDKMCDASIINKWLYSKANLRGPVQQWLLARMHRWPKGTTLLDAGCGAGATAFTMQHMGLLDNIKYTGVDASKLMLKIAQEKVTHPNAVWVHNDLAQFDIGTYDNIIIKSVLAHVLHPAPIIHNLVNRLAIDGTMYILFWINPCEGKSKIRLNKDNFYVNAHSRQELISILETVHLQLIEEHSVRQVDGLKQATRTNWVLRRDQ